MARGRPWSSHEDAMLRRFWLRNMKCAEIAGLMPRRTASAIRSRAHEIGLPARPELVPVGKPSGIWTDERKELVRAKYLEGFSASQIAGLLDVPVTRNAVIGAISRMGLSRSPESAARRASRRPSQKRARKVAAAPLPSSPVLPAEPAARMEMMEAADRAMAASADRLVPLRDLENDQCHWPLGDPQREPFGFCGDQKVPGLPYCKAHAMRAYDDPERAFRRAEQRARDQHISKREMERV